MIHDIFTNPCFHAIAVPIIFVFIGVGANLLGDASDFIERDHFAVGTNLFIMMFATIIADIRIHFGDQKEIEACVGWLVIWAVLIFTSLLNDKFFSREVHNGKKRKKMKTGIVGPTIIGTLFLILYQLDRLKII